MGVKVTYTHPNYPKGHVFAMMNVGELPNGEEVTIEDEMLDAFEAANGMTFRKAVQSNKMFKVESATSKSKEGGDG